MSKNKLLSTFDFIAIGKQVVTIEKFVLSELEQYINNDFSCACKAIFACSGKIIVMGIGKSGHISRKLASTFASTGTAAFFIHPTEASHGDLGMISPQDIIIIISNSGESREILELIPRLKNLKNTIIGITGKHTSSLSKAANIHICVPISKEACPLGITPTSSTTATLVMCDALAMAVLKARGFTAKDFFLSHPGGTLGQKLLLRVSDIMHTGNDIPVATSTTLLREVLTEITQKKLGMVVICDVPNIIVGIFTDGDLRRVFDTNIDINKVHISEVMIHGGMRVTPDTLVLEALQIMQINNITSLLVAQLNTLIGIIHIHDILRMGIF